MKTNIASIVILLLAVFGPLNGLAQEENQSDTTRQMVVIIKNDGTEYIGYILKQDEREVLLETEKLGNIYIPKHEIKEIKNISEKDIINKEYMGSPVFGTRYFITTNGFNGEKGEHYAIWNYWGPDVQFSVSDNVTLGVMTTWVGMPLLGSIKIGKKLNDQVAVGAGVLGGPLTWLDPEAGAGFLAYGAVTFGSSAHNVNFSAGYVNATDVNSAGLASVGMHQRISKNFSFVFDSIIILAEGSSTAIIMPGFRMLQSPGKAIQFGLTGLVIDGEAIPVPIPVVGWMRAF